MSLKPKQHRTFRWRRPGLSRTGVVALAFLATLLAVPLAGALARAYKPTVIRVGNLVITANGGITPSVLPKHERAPIKANVSGTLTTVDGSHPPPVETVTIDVDKNFVVRAEGLPVCSMAKIEARSTAEARRACPDAIVGSGVAEAEVAFPEQAPFTAKGPLVFFNGGVRNGTTLLLVHLYAAVPAPTAIVAPVKITRVHDGRYGIHVVAEIPLIAGGSGSVVNFGVSIGRNFVDMGKKRGYLEAKCPTGTYLARAQVTFRDQSSYKATLSLPCGPNGGGGGYTPQNYRR